MKRPSPKSSRSTAKVSTPQVLTGFRPKPPKPGSAAMYVRSDAAQRNTSKGEANKAMNLAKDVVRKVGTTAAGEPKSATNPPRPSKPADKRTPPPLPPKRGSGSSTRLVAGSKAPSKPAPKQAPPRPTPLKKKK